ncbi:benzoate/H(+) symporter BenE family transporter [Roseovarius sp. SK2]|uniref:benzoate/H(+) symporter BenE family transporter n=2 Tax=Roseobacteraceae TaxID=2854170 RepID=UPI00237A6031|nr:benzoate/H(+) symporter BenE family transporter [Roseovarius sp. SK2]MDD9725658.1 benzoate/H(+) symporter BenE family transporter [Roseovarius sp. SK2]
MPPMQTISTGFVVAMVGFFSSFPIVLQGLAAVGASDAQAASGLMAAALAMGLAGIVLSLWTKMPASVAWSTPGAALLAVTAPVEAGFAGAVAGFLVAGALTVISGLWRPLGRLAAAIPAPLAQAMLGGVLLPLVIRPVLAVAETPVVIGPILAAWFVLGRINKLLAVPGAVVAAGITVLAYGDLGAFDARGWVTAPVFVMPEFSLAAVVGIGLPLYVVTMATQNVPGLAVMRAHGYAPEPGPLLSVVGGFSVLSAPGGAPQTCLAAITAAMCADEDSHPDAGMRYWSAVMAGIFYCVLGVFAGVITAFAGLAPPMVMASVAGVALLSVFANSTAAALGDADYREAAVITFVVTASGVTVFGLGGAVWGLLAGGLVQVVRHASNGNRGVSK